MEMVFRKIENFIEGNANKQRKLDEMPWNREKILKKGTKHSIFFLISFAISHTFLAYIIGVDQLWAKISGSFAENYATFIGLFIFSVVFYLVFAKLRELVCIMICPYGRLQGVMLDPNSLVVAYDYIRGEPRGKIRKKENQENKGDCVECHLCVDVCPTGIDIRNGTQLECVNCTACMDACDSVMEKIDKPKGLIRIDSKNNIEEKQGFKLTGRVKAYAIVMILLLGASITILATRTSIEANVLKIPGMTYSKTDDGSIINMFNLTLVNKTFEDQVYSINMGGELGELTILDSDSVLQANSEVKKVFMIIIPRDELKSRNTKVPLEIYCNGELTKDLNINFLGP
jgi:cytochrome c oxidase accessory protein FixG